MKFTPLNMVLAAVVAYIVYQYFSREHMTNSEWIITAVVVVLVIALVGGLGMAATSR